MKKPLRERSPLVYVLVGLIPYSKPNILLSYKPSLFFQELEKVSNYKQATLRAAYARAEQQGLIKQHENVIKITQKGHRKITPFVATELDGRAYLMVIFDIPEDEVDTRRNFRRVLKEWQFRQVQKSVWITGKDMRDDLVEVIKEMELTDFVQIYESVRHFPK